MCTVSWLHNPNGYELFCNRDEQRTRQSAFAPAVQTQRGVQFIAPRDGQAGGTWISVNQFGLTLCLLNRHDGQTRATADVISRGLLVQDLADSDSHEELTARIAELEWQRFQPFTLLVLEPIRPALIVTWNGRESSIHHDGEAQMPLTSSSFDSANVIATRQNQFNQLGALTSDALQNFHHSHHPEPGPASICMHRPDAKTVSFSQILVNQHAIEFRYHPASPCQNAMTSVMCSIARIPALFVGQNEMEPAH